MAYRIQFSDYSTTASGPPDPERWIGPQGPAGPPGPPGPPGSASAGTVPEAPVDSFIYGRGNAAWTRALPLAGGVLTGALTLAANGSSALHAVTLQQLNAATGGGGGMLPLSGGTMTGPLVLSGNATAALNPVTKQQFDPIAALANGALLRAGGTMTGLLTLAGNATNPLHAVPLQQLTDPVDGYLKLTGGTMTGLLNVGDATHNGIIAFNSPPTGQPGFYWNNNSLTRWSLLTSGTESGSDSGSDLVVGRFADNGAYISVGISMVRATGVTSIPARLLLGGATDNLTDALQVNKSASIGNVFIGTDPNNAARGKIVSIGGSTANLAIGTPDVTSGASAPVVISAGNTSTGNGGNANLTSGSVLSPGTGNSGNVSIGSGSNSGTGNSGTVTIQTSTTTAGSSGLITVQTGATNTASKNSGGVTITTGNATGTTSNSGAFTVTTGTATQNRGNILLDGNNLQTASNQMIIGNATQTSQLSLILRTIASTGSASRNIYFQSGTLSRWLLAVDAIQETGSNVGANLGIIRFNDAGSTLGYILDMNRASGLVSWPVGQMVLGASALAVSTTFDLIAAAGQNRMVRYYSGANQRWGLIASSTAEGGSNAGSDFLINRYSDAGTFVDTAFMITRSTGVVWMPLGVQLGSSTVAADAFLSVYSSTPQNRGVRIFTGTTQRWQMGANNTAEGGSQAGSDWALQRYNDAGTLIDAPITVTRSTGNVTFTGSALYNAGLVTIGLGGNASTAALRLNSAVGQFRQIEIYSNGSLRWVTGANNAAEGGSQAGSDWILQRYSDAGAAIDSPIVVSRSSGNVNFAIGMSLITGGTGPTIRAGTGAATGTQPSGSIFIRTDGTAGNRLYVSQGGGTWVAIATV